jgi:hypothetical protein
MGKMKDFLLEQQEKGLFNAAEQTAFPFGQPEGITQVDKFSKRGKGKTYNKWASKHSPQLEKSTKSLGLNSEDIASDRFRKGSPGID